LLEDKNDSKVLNLSVGQATKIAPIIEFQPEKVFTNTSVYNYFRSFMFGLSLTT
jgi:hypothetical protein